MRSKDCRQTAFRILARRDHTQRELSDKLLRHGFLPREIDALCREFMEQGYISDTRVAASLLEGASANPVSGTRRFHQCLVRRGLKPELIEATVNAYRAHVPTEAVAERLAQVLSVRGKNRAFIERHLWRRGFSAQEIRIAVRVLSSTCIDNGHPEG